MDHPAGRSAPLLAVESLGIHFPGPEGPIRAADGVSFTIAEGETLGLVGESGCGKSATALALLRLVPEPGRIVSGRILLAGRDLMALSEREMCEVRGRRIGFVFQEPGAALNPVLTVGYQIAESLIVHRVMKKKEAMREAERLMALVRIPDAARRVREYPHQMSGGMRQRVMIAIALSCKPELLIADEPTTALDVTLQAEILNLLRTLRDELGLSLLLISHNLGVIAEMADRVAVMYAGRIVEQARARDLFREPLHPYTAGLLRSMPRLGASRPAGKERLQAIEGNVPDLSRLPPGCAFHPRCPEAIAVCRQAVPPILAPRAGREVACVLHGPGTAGTPDPRTAGAQR
ncbi:MAG TPA: ABC transporter ATP-binding protein [Candidatus Polarisedimenticolia bacterium]|nr:ABC transporter ATP-binding protein [Candidatus Polarisedimenticolia bacterium]